MPQKGRAIFLVYTDVSEMKFVEGFNAWYHTEHRPEGLACPGILSGARYEAPNCGPRYRSCD